MECFAGLGKAVVGVVAGIGSRAMRRATPDRNRAAPDRLIQQAGQLPRQTTLRESTQVRQAAVDDSLQPPPAPLPVQHVPVSTTVVTAYARNLTGVSAELSQLSSDAQHQGLTQPQQTELKRVASEHIDAVTHSLPAAFGMQPGAIKDWLLNYSGDPSAIASALRIHLTDQLGQSGHGAAAAQWLYQQVLSAGSTCLASQAAEPSRQRQYLEAAANEVRQLSTGLNATGVIQRLIAGWSQGRQAEQDNEKLWALQQQIRQDSVPGTAPTEIPVRTKVTELDDLSFEADQDAAVEAHEGFVMHLKSRIKQAENAEKTGDFDHELLDSILTDLTGKLEKILEEKLSQLGKPSAIWRLIKEPNCCPDWGRVRTTLQSSCRDRRLPSSCGTECERYILAWTELTFTRLCIARGDQSLAQHLNGVNDLCSFEKPVEGWEQVDREEFSNALAIIQDNDPPENLYWEFESTQVQHLDTTHSGMNLSGDLDAHADVAPAPSGNPGIDGQPRSKNNKTGKNGSGGSLASQGGPQSAFLNNANGKSGIPAIGVTRNKQGKAASGEANKATGSLQNTPKDVSSRESQERVADGGQALVTRKKKKKPAKTNEGKQPKSGQLRPLEGDGKPKVAASKGASTATQSPKVSTVEKYHDDVAKGKQAAWDRFADDMDRLMDELQASPSTVPATPKKQALAGSKLPNALDDSSIGQ